MVIHRNTALITGASSGLGECFAYELATTRAQNVILVARRTERMQQISKRIDDYWESADKLENKPDVHIFHCDLACEDSRVEFLNSVSDLSLDVSLLINNAGFGSVGHFADSDIELQRRMVNLNCIAAMHLSHHFLKEMIRKKEGTIINVCSIAAFQPTTYMTTYGATKSFLFNHSVALAQETSQYGIHVMAHCPGPTNTEFHIAAGLNEKMSVIPAMDARKVVLQALSGMDNKRVVVINGTINKFLALLARFLPFSCSAHIVERALRQYG